MNQNPSIPIEEQLKINDEFSQIREDEFNFNGLAKYINELKVNEEIISMHVNILNIRIRISKNNYVQTVLELVNSGLVPYLIELYRKQITIQLSADIECTILIQLEILTIMAATNFEKVEFNFKAKVIQFFIDLLKDKDFSMQEVAIQGLANIFAENIQLKKIAINQGAIEGIFEILKSNDSLQLQKNCLSVLENLYLTVAALQNYSSKNCLSIICSALHTLDDEESHCKLLSILTHHFIGSSIVMQSAEIIQFNLISKLIEFLDNNNQQISCLAQDSLFKIVEVNNINHEFDDQLLSSNLLNKIPKLLQTKYNNELIPIIQKFIQSTQYSIRLFQVSNFYQQLINMIQNYDQKKSMDSMRIISTILRKHSVLQIRNVQIFMNSGLLRYFKILLIQSQDDDLLILVLESILDILKIGKQLKENYYLIEYDQLNMFTQVYNLLKNKKCSRHCSNIINFY